MTRFWFPLLLLFVLLLSACATIPIPTLPTATPPSQALPAETPEAEVTETPEPPADLLPVDPAVRVGQLQNGFTYFIRENDEPMNRAELWLAINAGSNLEDEDQLGLAHFLEHMLFNGTENYEGSAIVDFFESIGMEFGPDVNAYTSFDETVYTISVPTDDEEALATAFDVLEDWAAYAALTPEEVDKERGVVVEENRLRYENASGRIQDKTIPFMLADSRYAERLPIGDMDIIRSAPPETVRRFYEDWYRPDLMGFIAVGDFDADEIEAQIEAHFSDLPAPETARAHTLYDVPYHPESRYLVVTDPEETLTQIELIHKRDAAPVRTKADLRDDLTTDLFYDMLNQRLDEISRQPDAPYLAAGVGSGEFVRTLAADFIAALAEDEAVLPALDALVGEVERVRRFGYTESELERAKINLLRSYETIFDERENIDNAAFSQTYLEHFLVGEGIPSIELLYEMVQEITPEITLAEVNEKSAALADSSNRVIILTAPEKEAIELPDEADLAATVETSLAQNLDPYEDAEVAESLLEQIPQPAEILSESSLDAIDATVLELANGVTVLFKSTDFKDDEVVFTSISPGGSSLVSDDDFPEAATISSVIAQSGLAEFDQIELDKLLTGKAAYVQPTINELTEGLSGAASPEDLETLFQLIHLYITAPRQDEDAFQVFQNQMRSFLVNRDLDPNAAMQDALLEALYGETIRRGQLSLEAIEGLDYARAFEIYRERFADAGDSSFVFVGSFDEDELKTLAQTYLGTLPTIDRDETWQAVAPDVSDEVELREVYKGEGDRSSTQIVFVGEFDPTRENKVATRGLEGVLDIILREELREERSGTYGVGVNTSIRELPESRYFVVVSFSSDPDRVEELVDAAFAKIQDLQENGPTEEDVAKVQAQILSNREEALENNSFWMALLDDYAFYGDDELLDTEGFEILVNALTAEEIQRAAQTYLRDSQYVQIILNPAAYAPEVEGG